jgi:uncharacterized protein YgiB involved in biofilm formation
MKRSEYIAIGAIGVLLVATFWPRSDPNRDPALDAVASGGSGFTTLAFASQDECRQSQAVTEQVCTAEFGKAQTAGVADAPKYDVLSDCEAEYGASQCRPATWNGAQVFIPALAGVLIARSLAGAATSQPLYPPRTGPQSCPPGVSLAERPECQPRSSSSSSSSSSGSSSSRTYYSTGSGRTIGRTTGAVLADVFLPSRTTVSRTTVAPRGGSFSGSSGSWSSSSSSSSSRSGTFSQSSSTTSSRGGFGSSGSSFGSSSS